MTSSDDEISETVHYREVISRDPPWWVATLYGPGIPEHGATVKSRALDELSIAVIHLYRHHEGGGVTDIEYDFGTETNAKLEGFGQAQGAMQEAWRNYFKLGRRVTSALAGEHKASLREIASILHESYWDSSRLRADRPVQSSLVHFHLPGLRHFLTEHAAPSLAHSAGIAARQARFIASDTLRQARRSMADWR